MITKTPAFQTSDGNTYQTLEIAQRAEMLKLLMPADASDGFIQETNRFLDRLFSELDGVKDILRASGRKPRAKKNGAVRKRKTAVEAAK